VVVLSFPRDLQVDRPACDAWDQTAGRYTGLRDRGEAKVEINTAYRYGGPLCATRTVQQVSGLAINHFVGMEFDGFKAMVGAVGSVQVCAAGPVKDEVLGDVVPGPGPAKLNGDKALDFVRASHVAGEQTPGDAEAGRIRRQQELLAALARAAASSQTLADPGRVNRLVDAMAANTFVDNVDANQLSRLAGALSELDAGRVTLVTVPATEAGDHRELRPEDATALFRAIIDDTSLTGDKPAAGPPQPGADQVPTVPPDQIKLQVVNGTGQEGLATQIAKKLRTGGFQIVTMDNAPQRADRTVIRYAPGREKQALTVAAAVPRAALRLDPAMGGAVEVLLGGDFDGAVEPVRLGEPVQPRLSLPAEQGQPTVPARPDTVNAADAPCG
jgi:LCP family protein required for cell wall assembly